MRVVMTMKEMSEEVQYCSMYKLYVYVVEEDSHMRQFLKSWPRQ